MQQKDGVMADALTRLGAKIGKVLFNYTTTNTTTTTVSSYYPKDTGDAALETKILPPS